MANASVSRIGQINQTGDALALFLKQFAGEVLTKYLKKTIMTGKHRVRTITSGKSASFPAIGGIDAEYHTPGTELNGLGVNHGERVIAIDGLLLSHAYLAIIDEAMNHYDVRAPYAAQMGNTLAAKYDLNVMKEVIAGARASANVADGFGGTVIEDANLGSTTDATKADAIIGAIYAGMAALEEKDVDTDEVYCALKPSDYYLLVNTVQSTGFSAINKLYGGSGSFAEGTVYNIGGATILKSNQLPTTDTSSSDTYHGINADTTTGIMWTPDAVGTVKLLDLSSETMYDMRRQAWLLVTKMAVGHGYLRPECCVEFRTGAPA